MYSIDGAYPVATLPLRHRLSSGLTRTSLSDLTTQELAALDPPITVVSDPPSFNANTEYLAWDGSSWSVEDLSSGQIAAILAAAIPTRQTAIDSQRDALLAAGKTISGKTYDGSIGTIGGMTVSRERTGRLAGALTKVITNITQANPGVITSAVHGIPTGQWVLVEDIVGMTELNDNTYVAESLSGTTLKLKTLAGRDINTTSFTAYTSGGTLKTVVPYITVDNKTVYLDYATAVTVIDTLTEWHNSMYLQGRSHKNAVAALSTVAAVEAYDSDSWPT